MTYDLNQLTLIELKLRYYALQEHLVAIGNGKHIEIRDNNDNTFIQVEQVSKPNLDVIIRI